MCSMKFLSEEEHHGIRALSDDLVKERLINGFASADALY